MRNGKSIHRFSSSFFFENSQLSAVGQICRMYETLVDYFADGGNPHVWTDLNALESLDRYSFHKSDGRDNMDVLYSNVFKSVPQDITASSDWKVDVEPLVFLLCRWSVSTRRTGIHRGMVIACLLEKFQTHLWMQLQRNDDGPEIFPGYSTNQFLFQDTLMRYDPFNEIDY